MKKLPAEKRSSKPMGAMMGREDCNESKPVHSEKFTCMLTVHRTTALQVVMMMNQPDVALIPLVHRLASQVFSTGGVAPVKLARLLSSGIKPPIKP